ncbi:hypothetical protein F4781DRAFT_418184 [Annulohypoxylon bovei var. microspora]|nr:hypothetical protein F4781DRAFT_418184 [Annulohypoxylon bovei var. microspora]
MSDLFDVFRSNIENASESVSLLGVNLHDDNSNGSRRIIIELEAKLKLLNATIGDVQGLYNDLKCLEEKMCEERKYISDKEAALQLKEEELQASQPDLERTFLNQHRLSTTATATGGQNEPFAAMTIPGRSELEPQSNLRCECDALRSDRDALRRQLKAQSRTRDKNAPWQRISDNITVFISRCRPSVEEGCSVSLRDIVLHILLPSCWITRSNDNLMSFLREADSSRWYCFRQVLEMSPGYGGSMIPEDELCRVHGSRRCYQIKLAITDSDERSIIFRVAGIESEEDEL